MTSLKIFSICRCWYINYIELHPFYNNRSRNISFLQHANAIRITQYTQQHSYARTFALLLHNLFLLFQIILVLKSFNLYGNSHVTVTIQIVAHVLAYTNSCVNPVLYAFLSENFRKAFRKVSIYL